MKPKDLKFPFSWEKREPLLVDRVFFIPKFYDSHSTWEFPIWQDGRIFGRESPIWIEYCSGNGAWIIEKAKKNPDSNWIAVEKRFDRVQKIWSKMKNSQLDNLFIVCGEALAFTQYYVSAESFEGIFINFPDPWPKARHSKHRLLEKDFMTQMARVLKQNAKAVIVTDHVNYAHDICNTMLQHPSWIPVFSPPYFVTEWQDYGSSYFDQLWRMRKKTIHYLQFQKKKGENGYGLLSRP